jgi:hypothetical protein
VQLRPGVSYAHLGWIRNYIAEKKPDVVVCLGDFADMASLSSYDKGKLGGEGKRYAADVAAARAGMELLTGRWGYKPRKELTLGNHEYRIDRAAEENPALFGTISTADLGYERHGWTVRPFLKPVHIDGISYAHYFVSGIMGRPVSSAAALLRARHGSAVMGHVQKVDIAIHPATQHIALMAGICYLHDEPYLTPQGNSCKRGIWLLNEVRNGVADPMFVSLGYLKRKYS